MGLGLSSFKKEEGLQKLSTGTKINESNSCQEDYDRGYSNGYKKGFSDGCNILSDLLQNLEDPGCLKTIEEKWSTHCKQKGTVSVQ